VLDCKRVNVGASFSTGFEGGCVSVGAKSARIGERLMGVSRTGGDREESDGTAGMGADMHDRIDDSDFLVKSI